MIDPTIAGIAADLTYYRTHHWPRSKQVSTGASQIYRCRAETVLRLNGAPSVPRSSWQAEVGSAIDAHLGTVRSTLHGLIRDQVRVNYKGVPATVDEHDMRPGPDGEVGVVRDWKTKDNAGAIRSIAKYGPPSSNIAQVNIGAAALIDEGYPIAYVELVYLPRGGRLEDAWVWRAAPDREIADAAVAWKNEMDEAALQRSPLPWAEQADGLRDEYPSWCYTYCELVNVCRGPMTDVPPVDAHVEAAAYDYLEAKQLAEVAEGQKEAAKRVLEPYLEIPVQGGRLAWQGGNSGSEVDWSKVAADYKAIIGDLPEKPKTTARSLRFWADRKSR